MDSISATNGVYALYLESFDSLLGIDSTLRTDTFTIVITECNRPFAITDTHVILAGYEHELIVPNCALTDGDMNPTVALR